MRDYTYPTKQATKSRTQDDKPISTTISRYRRIRHWTKYSLTQGTANNVSNSTPKGNNSEDDSCVCRRINSSDLVGHSSPCRRVTPCE